MPQIGSPVSALQESTKHVMELRVQCRVLKVANFFVRCLECRCIHVGECTNIFKSAPLNAGCFAAVEVTGHGCKDQRTAVSIALAFAPCFVNM